MLGTSKNIWGFDPRSVPGCQLWLDGADQSSMTLSGSSVTQWNDKSGNGLNVSAASSQPTYVTNGLNGLGTLAFNGSQGLSAGSVTAGKLLGSSGTSATFCVFSVSDNTAGSCPISWDDSSYTYRFIITWESSGIIFDLGDASAGVANRRITIPSSSITFANNTYYLISFWQSGGVAVLNVNGGAYTVTTSSGFTGNIPTSTSRTLNIGTYINTSTYNLKGNIAEILVYNTHLPSNFKQVEGYLAHKWGLNGYYDSSIPLSIPGCQLWLDGADSSTVTGTTSVTQWRDKSGNGRNTTTTGTVSYANSGISITTSSSYLTGSFGSPDYTGTTLSCFIVASMNSASGSVGRLLGLGKVGTQDWDNLASMIAFARGGGLVLRTYRNSQTLASPPSIPAYDTRFLASSGQTSSATFMSINGGTISTQSLSGAFAINAYRIGHDLAPDDVNEQFNGVINEIIVYFSELTTTQRQSIEGYLARKWGFTSMYSALPSIHPFSSIRPHLRVFQPTDIDGCQLWLDGADQGSMTLSGSSVTQWRDKSGRGFNVATSSGATAPLYNSSTKELQFVSGNSNSFTIPQAFGDALVGTTFSFFFIGRRTVNTTYVYFLSGATSGGNQNLFIGFLSNKMEIGEYGPYASADIPTFNSPDPMRLYYYDIQSSTTANLIMNGNPLSTTVSGNLFLTSFAQPELGRRYGGAVYHDFNLSEMVVFSPALNTSQRQQVEGYLAHKWGLSPTYATNTPLSIPGCQLWLDAADSSTITGTTSITAWRDKSGRGNNAVFTGTNPSYVAASNVVITANLNQGFTVPAATIQQTTGSGSIFLVYGDQQTQGSSYAALFSSPLPAQSFCQSLKRPDSYSYQFNNSTSPVLATVVNALNTTNTIIYTMNYTYNSTTGSIRVNGTTCASSFNSSPTPSGALTISSSGWGDGANVRLYEIITFVNVVPLTTVQQQQIEGYLAKKWGLTVSGQFLSTHPFKSIPPASLPFSPRNISGLQLWLDAADTSTLTVSGSNVSSWRDKSGNNNNATQPTLANQPTTGTLLNGLNVLDFTGTQPFFSFPTISFTNITVFTIFRNTTLRAYCSPLFIGPFFFFFTDGAGNNLYGTGRLGVNGEGIISQAAAGITTTNYLLYSLNLTVGATDIVNFYINGANAANFNGAASGGRSYYQVGSTDGVGATTGFTAEILVYNGVLNNSQRQQIEGYLAQKWGLTTSLPATHPYVKLPA